MGWWGGSKVFLEGYIKRNLNNKEIFILQQFPTNEGVDVFIISNPNQPDKNYQIEKNAEILSNLVNKLGINSIFINHLLSFDLQFIMNWVLNSKLPFTFFTHDHLCICPNYNLDCHAKFCHENKTNKICRYFFNKLKFPSLTIENWRSVFYQFLSKAEHVYAPSNYTVGLIKQFYPKLNNIEARPHYLSIPLKKTFRSKFAARDKLRIVFLGNMFKHKGEAYLLLGNEFIQRERLPIEFVLCGRYTPEVNVGSREGIIFTGKYNNNNISDILAQLQTAIVATMSICPETYCYSASEAILSGYPVLAMNMGAHSLRVKNADCGWIFPFDSPSNGLDEFKTFLSFIVTPEGRKQILLKAKNTRKFKNGME